MGISLIRRMREQQEEEERESRLRRAGREATRPSQREREPEPERRGAAALPQRREEPQRDPWTPPDISGGRGRASAQPPSPSPIHDDPNLRSSGSFWEPEPDREEEEEFNPFLRSRDPLVTPQRYDDPNLRSSGSFGQEPWRPQSMDWYTPQDQFSLTPEQQQRRNLVYQTGSPQPRYTLQPDELWPTYEGARVARPPQRPAFPQPDILRGEYQAPNRPIIPVPARPMIDGQIQDDSLITGGQNPLPAIQQYARGRGEVLRDAWQQYRASPEYRYAQAAAQTRAGWTPPETLREGLEEHVAGSPTMPAVVGSAAWAVAEQVLGRNPTARKAMVKLQDFLQFGAEVPGIYSVNAPGFGGVSVSEVVTPALTAIFSGMTEEELAQLKQGKSAGQVLLGRISRSVQGTQAARREVAAAERTDDDAVLALRNIGGRGGAERVTETLTMITQRDQMVQDLISKGNDLVAGDPIAAAEYYRQAQELSKLTLSQMVEMHMDPVMELFYGVVADPTEILLSPLALALQGVQELRQARRVSKLANMSDEAVMARLATAQASGKKAVRAVAEGPRAANEVYQEIIAPFQSKAEQFVRSNWTRPLLLRPTKDASISMDAKMGTRFAVSLLNGITDKGDVAKILNIAANNPQQLVKGVVGLSQDTVSRFGQADGAVRWAKEVVAQDSIVRRIPLFKIAERNLANLPALQGTGKVDAIQLQAGIHEALYEAAQRVWNGTQPRSLPFGASDIRVERTGANDGKVVFLDDKGKVIQEGTETTYMEALRQFETVMKSTNPDYNFLNTPYDIARALSRLQKNIMNDVWLFSRPANWIGNALSAAVMMVSHDAYTTIPLSSIQDWASAKMGGFMPTVDLLETVPNTAKLTNRKMADEMGGSFIGDVAAFVTRKKDNRVSRFMKFLQDIPYGQGELKIGNISIIGSEQANKAKVTYVTGKRAFDRGIAQNVANNLMPQLMRIEGMTPQLAESVMNHVVTAAINGGKADILPKLRQAIGKPTIGYVLKELGVAPELISPANSRAIEQLLMDAKPSDINKAIQNIREIFRDERMHAAQSLIFDPGAPNAYWTDADMTQSAAAAGDALKRDALRAGLDPEQANQQAGKMTTDLLQSQQQAFDKVIADLGQMSGNPAAWQVASDFYADYLRLKAMARETVDKASEKAIATGGTEAWQEKWRVTQQTYTQLQQDLADLTQQTRLKLQEVAAGGEYKARYTEWKNLDDYLNWDEIEFKDVRSQTVGAPTSDDPLWKRKIQLNRQLLDNSYYELTAVFGRYPTLENFDILRTATERIEAMGALVAGQLAKARDEMLPQKASVYYALRNKMWDEFFDQSAELNNVFSKVVVQNGIRNQAATGLQWTEGDATWRLRGPSKTEGKWWAVDINTGVKQEFSVGDAADEANPFVVPQAVVDDFRRLAQMEPDISVAADRVLDEIAAAAPAPKPATENVVEPPSAPPAEVVDEVFETPAPPPAPPTPAPTRTGPYSTPPDPDLGRRGGYTVEPPRDRGRKTGYNDPVPDAPRKRYSVQEEIRAERAEVDRQMRDSIRAQASEQGIPTATKAGKPFDNALMASINKRLQTNYKSLAEVPSEELPRIQDILEQRRVEKGGFALESPTPTPSPQRRPKDPKPVTPNIYQQGEDLPLMSGVPARGAGRTQRTGSTGGVSRGRGAKGPREEGRSTRGQLAAEEIKALKEQRAFMRRAWDRDAAAGVGRAGQGRGQRYRGLRGLEDYARRYGRDGTVRWDIDDGRELEDLIGTTVGGETLESQADIERYIQRYIDVQKQIRSLEAQVKDSTRYKKMSAEEILMADGNKDLLLSSGYTEGEIQDILLQPNPRNVLLDIIEQLTAAEDEVFGPDWDLRRYEATIPSIFGTPIKDEGMTLWERVFGPGRATGNNKPVTQADVAHVTIRNLTDAENRLIQDLPWILQGKPNELSGAQKLAALDAVANWLPQFDVVLDEAMEIAERMANHVMLDPNNRRDLDTLLSIMVPYHYFWSRMPSRLVSAAVHKPGMVNLFYEINRGISLENQQAGVPERLEGTLPFLDQQTSGRIGLKTLLFNYAMGGAVGYFGSDFASEPDETDNRLEKQLKTLGVYDGLNLWVKVLMDIGDGTFDKDYSYALNNLVPIPGIGVPVSTAVQGLTGEMPAQNGIMGKFGFGPDKWDVSRADTVLERIGERDGVDPALLGYASQIIHNQYAGADPFTNVPEQYQEQAQALATQAIKESAQNRAVQRATSYTTTMPVQAWTEEEKALTRANEQFWATGYNEEMGTGGKQLGQDFVDANPTVQRAWAAGGETPGVDAQLNQVWDQINFLNERIKQSEAAAIAGVDLSIMDRDEIKALKEEASRDDRARVQALHATRENLEKQQIKGDSTPTDRRNPAEKERERVEALVKSINAMPGRPPKDPPAGLEGDALNEWYDKRSEWYDNRERLFIDALTQPITSEAERGTRKVYSAKEAKALWDELDTYKYSTGEKETARLKEIGAEDEFYNQFYDEYDALPEGKGTWDQRIAWLAAHPEWAQIHAERIARKYGELPSWADELGITVDPRIIAKGQKAKEAGEDIKQGGKSTGSSGKTATSGGESGLAPGSVSRDNFTDEELDQYYESYFAFNESKDWDGLEAWLLENPEFARYEADRAMGKDGEYPWWYKDIFGEGGSIGTGKLGKGGSGKDGKSWRAEWKEYRAFGDDDAAKKQYLIDNPEFAEEYLRFIREDDPTATAWWLEEYTPRSYYGGGGGYYGGGGGGGSSYTWRAPAPQYMPQAQGLSRGLADIRLLDYPWRLQSDTTPDWLYAGRDIGPDEIRRWTPPRL